VDTLSTNQPVDETIGAFPSASVVLVNWNGIDLTRAALRGLREQTYPNLDVIVIDNGSRQDEARMLAADFPEARYLRLERNTGFTGGANWGVALARGEWVVLLNNDAIPDADCVKRLVYAQRATGAWAVSGRLIDLEDPELVGAAVRAIELETEERDGGEAVVWNVPEELAWALEESHLNNGLSYFGYTVRDAYGRRLECFYPSGGLCCLPRRTVELLGPAIFPQQWFAYYEDVALGFRIRARGGWVAKEPRAAAVHLASSTARSLGSARLTYLRERNRIQTLRSWLPARALWALLPLNMLLPLGVLLRLIATEPLSALGYAWAHAACLFSQLSLTRQRYICQAELDPAVATIEGQLSGKIRGGGGPLNALTMAWCRLLRLPCIEDLQPPEG
jgi:GT2 family glycosyltransferase